MLQLKQNLHVGQNISLYLSHKTLKVIQNKTVSRGSNSVLSFGRKNDFFFVPMPKSEIKIKLNYSLFISFFLCYLQLSDDSVHSECSIFSPPGGSCSKEWKHTFRKTNKQTNNQEAPQTPKTNLKICFILSYKLTPQYILLQIRLKFSLTINSISGLLSICGYTHLCTHTCMHTHAVLFAFT